MATKLSYSFYFFTLSLQLKHFSVLPPFLRGEIFHGFLAPKQRLRQREKCGRPEQKPSLIKDPSPIFFILPIYNKQLLKYSYHIVLRWFYQSILCTRQENKARYTAIQSRTVGQEQYCENRSKMWRTDRHINRPTDTARCRAACPRLKTTASVNNIIIWRTDLPIDRHSMV